MITDTNIMPMCFGDWEAAQISIKSVIINFSACSVSADLIYVGGILCNDPILNIETQFLLKDRHQWIVEHTTHELWGTHTTTAGFRKIMENFMVETFAPIFDGIMAGDELWTTMLKQFSKTD